MVIGWVAIVVAALHASQWLPDKRFEHQSMYAYTPPSPHAVAQPHR